MEDLLKDADMLERVALGGDGGISPAASASALRDLAARLRQAAQPPAQAATPASPAAPATAPSSSAPATDQGEASAPASDDGAAETATLAELFQARWRRGYLATLGLNEDLSW